ncbi:MAG: tyrosine-protein phosphatase [Nitrospirae bacterium]|nr:tyrosine-protein phosphatase [Nitrospirota bacterium]
MKKKRLFLTAVCISLFVFACYHLFFTTRIETVVGGRVYRSAQLSAEELQKIIREKGIRAIVNLRGDFREDEWYVRERAVAERNHVRLYDIMLSANELPQYAKLMAVLDILSNEERPILIHCRRGSDRTGLVSALALAIEKDPPLSAVKEQFSWRYGVFPFYRSIGPALFSEYERWLAKTGKRHDKTNLLFWMKNEYQDNQGNLEFWMDHANGMEFRDRKAMVGGRPGSVVIEGWAFDARTRRPVEDLYVSVGSQAAARASFLYDRPDVARHFGLGGKYYERFPVGWKAEPGTVGLGKGCHEVFLKVLREATGPRDVPSDFQVCF